MEKTSFNSPIRIAGIQVGSGTIGMTFCPGKHDIGSDGVLWARDPRVDLDAIVQWGASSIVSIMERDEFTALNVPDLGSLVLARGMAWHHLPVADQSVPSGNFMHAWSSLSKSLQRRLAAGEKIVLHCRGGLGRTGLIAALLLIDLGWGADAAIKLIRETRSARAIETKEQEEYVRRYLPYLSHASLLGGAIGDSLGADIEFSRIAEIRQIFPDGPDRLARTHAVHENWFTDDTQMTLFTAEGLIRAQVCRHQNGTMPTARIVHHALLRWFATQGGSPAHDIDHDTGLITQRDLWHQAAPGRTCLSALEAPRDLGAPAANDSKGCGTIMRVAPVALAFPADDVQFVAMSTSALTHGHPVAQLAAAAWAELLSAALHKHDVGSAAWEIVRRYSGSSRESDAVAWAMRDALTAPRDGRVETVEALGGGWVAEEALAIALYAALAGKDFEDGLRIAVTHSGDSDSTGAIAGNLLGLLYPRQVFEHRWAQEVGGRDIIAKLAVDLPMARWWSSDEAARQWERYPGW